MHAGNKNRDPRSGLSRSFRPLSSLLLLGVLAACGGGSVPTEATFDGLALQLAGGTYSDGSGRVGLALLTTLRDAQGRGPEAGWTGSLRDSAGVLAPVISYEADREVGSYGAWWWPDVGAASGESYTLTLQRAPGEEVQASFTLADDAGLSVPELTLAAQGTQLSWAPVPGAAGYACRVYAGGSLQLAASSDTPACDISSLPEGAYSAEVLAFSTSLEALHADGAQRPQVAPAFHVSEGRLAFAKGQDASATHVAAAAGGPLHYGRTQPGLALWTRLTRADGTPFAVAGEVELVGPGLRADAPLRFSYPAGVSQHLVWSYDASPLPGLYTLTARVDGQTLSTRFSIGELAELSQPTEVQVVPASSGGADVSWAPVTGARTYYVSVWDNVTWTLKAARWTTEPTLRFDSGSFAAGRSYDVFVAATDVDLASASTPTRVAASENTYLPTTFSAQ